MKRINHVEKKEFTLHQNRIIIAFGTSCKTINYHLSFWYSLLHLWSSFFFFSYRVRLHLRSIVSPSCYNQRVVSLGICYQPWNFILLATHTFGGSSISGGHYFCNFIVHVPFQGCARLLRCQLNQWQSFSRLLLPGPSH